MLSTITFLSWLACGSEPINSQPESSKETVIVSKKHSVPAADDRKKFAFKCCKSPALGTAFELYLKLTESLASDAPSEAQFLAFSAAIDQAINSASDGQDQSEPTQSPFQELKAVASIAKGIGSKPLNNTNIRAQLDSLSQPMIAAVATSLVENSSDSSTEAVLAFCPMDAGHWLQSSDTLRNPYWGAEMLECGVFEDIRKR